MRSILKGSYILYSSYLVLDAMEEVKNLLTGVEGVPCLAKIGANSSIFMGPFGV